MWSTVDSFFVEKAHPHISCHGKDLSCILLAITCQHSPCMSQLDVEQNGDLQLTKRKKTAWFPVYHSGDVSFTQLRIWGWTTTFMAFNVHGQETSCAFDVFCESPHKAIKERADLMAGGEIQALPDYVPFCANFRIRSHPVLAKNSCSHGRRLWLT